MLATTTASFAFAPAVQPLVPQARMASPVMETAADLEALSQKLNPAVGFYDPLGIVQKAKDDGNEMETLGWYRHAEIKHGRVAMAAFVGFCVQSNGITLPGNLTPDLTYAELSAVGGPADQWDALPTAAKVQILCFIGFLELYSETTMFLKEAGEKHYVYGGKPGFFPPFSKASLPHPVPLNLFDPLGFTSKLTEEQKARKLQIELNNGRLAQIGIFGFVCESKGLIVPGMDSIDGIKPYAGEYMAPFAATDNLPFVQDMLGYASNNLNFGNFVPNLY
jgi:hypothetical protein